MAQDTDLSPAPSTTDAPGPETPEEYEDAIAQLSAALHREEDGLATAEYGIVMLAIVTSL